MKTFILMWNPAISSYTMERFEDDFIDLHEGGEGVGNWSVWEHELAQSGDEFYMVRVGQGNTGIVMHGHFWSDPYQDEDWSGKGRPTFYCELAIDMQVHSDKLPILTTETLMKELPGFDWTGGHSGRVLDGELATKLGVMWKGYISTIKGDPEDLYLSDCTE